MNKIFLLADDDPDDRELFFEALEAIDQSIICYYANNGQAVLDLLGGKQLSEYPQLIFLDINMPVMSGWECLTQLKKSEAYSKIPVFMYSTSSNKREIDIAFDLGASCFFTKPLDFKELKSTLQVIADNLTGDLMEAIKYFNQFESSKAFSCK